MRRQISRLFRIGRFVFLERLLQQIRRQLVAQIFQNFKIERLLSVSGPRRLQRWFRIASVLGRKPQAVAGGY